jgi:NADPH2:quinone reductase
VKAAVLTEAGQAPVVTDFEDPAPIDGEQVADVLLAALNPIDRHLASGMLGPPKLPSVVGQEGIGRLDGRRVYFTAVRPPFGSIAERVPVGDRVYDVPDDIDAGAAVAIGIAGTTALIGLRNRGALQPGQTVLVLGASGALGQVAVQAAKRLGAGRVVAAARHAPTLDALRTSGAADATVVLKGDDAAALKDAAEGGYDLVLDPVFGPPFEAALPATKFGARYIVCGSVAPTATIGYGSFIGRTLISLVTGPAIPTEEHRGAYEDLLEYVRAGDVRIEVEHLPIDRIADGWDAQGAAPHRKLVIDIAAT